MVKFLATLLAGLVSLSAFGATFQSTQSGLFSAATTWTNGAAPSTNNDVWIIATNHTVWYDMDNSSTATFTNGWGASTLSGTLEITNACYLKMGGSVSGYGYLLVGTSNNPITYTADNRPSVVFEATAGYWNKQRAASAYIFGDTNGFVGYITNSTVVAGDNTNLWFSSNVTGVASNDVVVIDNHNVNSSSHTVHCVYSVETNRITLFSAIVDGAAVVTNTWWGQAFTTGLPTNARTNGTIVVKASRPIVYMQKSKLSSQYGISGNTNIFKGVRIQTIDQPFVGASTTGNYLESCVAAGLNGSIAMMAAGTGSSLIACVSAGGYGLARGTGVNMVNCVQVGSSYLLSNGTKCYVTNAVVRNAQALATTCSESIFSDCDARWTGNALDTTGNSNLLVRCYGKNTASAGCIGNACNGNRFVDCESVAFGSSQSPFQGGTSYELAFINCKATGGPLGSFVTGAYAINCIGVSNVSGLFNNCDSITAVNCVVTNGGTGGIANRCDGATIIHCNAYNQAAPVRSYQSIGLYLDDTNGLPFSSLVTQHPVKEPYHSAQLSGTNWMSGYGNVYLTNITTSFSSNVYAHVPTASNSSPVVLWKDISLKPFSARSVGVYTLGTNNIGWSYAALPARSFTVTPTDIAGTSGWVFTSVSFTNGYPVDKTFTLWLQSVSTNALHVGYSWVDLPTDYTTAYR